MKKPFYTPKTNTLRKRSWIQTKTQYYQRKEDMFV